MSFLPAARSFWVRPEVVVVFLSLVLSVVAISGVITIGKDGIFYLDIARSIAEGELSNPFSRFDWPWFSILLAYTSKLTGVGYEAVAYFYSIVFMAGLSLLLVLIVKKHEPGAAWWAVLLVLTVPVFNGFRHEIIRETGFWFFSVLAIWCLQPIQEAGWRKALLFQLSIVLAALFRFEAVFLVLAGSIYSLLSLRQRGINKVIAEQFKITWLFLLGAISGLLLLACYDVGKIQRIQSQVSQLNPYSLYESFMRTSQQFAHEALLKWSYSDAPKMLLAGIIFVLVFRALTYAGLVSCFFVNKSFRDAFKKSLVKLGMNFSVATIYFLILFVFFVQVKFVNSRYMALLLIMLVPVFAISLHSAVGLNRKILNLFVIVSVLVGISNVVSFGDKKTHYLEAAHWIMENINPGSRIYYEDARIQYYAGRGYGIHHPAGLEGISTQDRMEYDYFVIETDRKMGDKVVEDTRYKVIASFSSRKKTIFVLQ